MLIISTFTYDYVVDSPFGAIAKKKNTYLVFS